MFFVSLQYELEIFFWTNKDNFIVAPLKNDNENEKVNRLATFYVFARIFIMLTSCSLEKHKRKYNLNDNSCTHIANILFRPVKPLE